MKKFISMLAMLSIVITLAAQEQNQASKQVTLTKKEGFLKANPANLAPKFTPEQQKQMKEFKLALQKEMIQLNNQLGEKKAQLKTLQQVDKPNMKSVYAKIDEISDLQNKKMKLIADNRNNVRSILTDEQRVMFDLNGGKMQGKHCKMQMQQTRMAQNGQLHMRMAQNRQRQMPQGARPAMKAMMIKTDSTKAK